MLVAAAASFSSCALTTCCCCCGCYLLLPPALLFFQAKINFKRAVHNTSKTPMNPHVRRGSVLHPTKENTGGLWVVDSLSAKWAADPAKRFKKLLKSLHSYTSLWATLAAYLRFCVQSWSNWTFIDPFAWWVIQKETNVEWMQSRTQAVCVLRTLEDHIILLYKPTVRPLLASPIMCWDFTGVLSH